MLWQRATLTQQQRGALNRSNLTPVPLDSGLKGYRVEFGDRRHRRVDTHPTMLELEPRIAGTRNAPAIGPWLSVRPASIDTVASPPLT